MRLSGSWFALLAGVCLLHAWACGQEPPRRDDDAVGSAVGRLMAFDKDGDGKLTPSELTDERLAPLAERADANNDSVFTRDELAAQLAKEGSRRPRGRGFGAPPNAGPGGPPPIGRILPEFLIDALELSEAQRAKLTALQAEVDERLKGILSERQREMLEQLRRGGPPGGPPGREAPRRRRADDVQ